jgi:uncharacterized glyoxalase superfamily protein PhnB
MPSRSASRPPPGIPAKVGRMILWKCLKSHVFGKLPGEYQGKLLQSPLWQDSPSRRDSQPHGLRQAFPELPFDNVPAAVPYYRDVLGFRITYHQDDLGVMDRDAITVLLIARTEQHKGIGSFGTYVSDVDALYAELLANDARILGEPVSHPWGLRNFIVLDLEGNRITFSQTFE